MKQVLEKHDFMDIVAPKLQNITDQTQKFNTSNNKPDEQDNNVIKVLAMAGIGGSVIALVIYIYKRLTSKKDQKLEEIESDYEEVTLYNEDLKEL